MLKINDLISSSLTKSLAIPATIFLTTTRTQAIASAKLNANLNEIVATNIGIALVSIIVSFVFYLMIMTELHSIKSIKSEYNSLMTRLEDKSAEAYSTIKEFKVHLGDRLTYAKRIFITLIILAIANGIGSIYWVAIRTTEISLTSIATDVTTYCQNIYVFISALFT